MTSDRIDYEIVSRRAEFEQVSLRNAELRARETAQLYSRAKSNYEQVREKLEVVHERVGTNVREVGDPRVALLHARSSLAKLKHMHTEVRHAQDTLACSMKSHAEASRQHGLCRERVEHLKRMAHAGHVHKENVMRSREEEQIVEAKISERSIALDEVARPNADAVPISSERESPHLLENSARSVGLAPFEQGKGQNAYSANQQENTARDAHTNHPASSQSLAANVHLPRASAYADKISDLSSWITSRQSGVEFSFISHSGNPLQIRIAREDKGFVSVSIVPHSLADRRSMSRALDEIRTVLVQHGLQVREAVVSSASSRMSHL